MKLKILEMIYNCLLIYNLFLYLKIFFFHFDYLNINNLTIARKGTTFQPNSQKNAALFA